MLILNHVCLQWVFARYLTFLLCDDDPILGSYLVLNRWMAYSWHMPSLCNIYTWIIKCIVALHWLLQKQQIELACTYHNQGWGQHIIPKKVLFNAIHMPGTRHIIAISIQLRHWWPSVSSQRPGLFQIWTACRFFLFLWQKGPQCETGACRNSTSESMCWSHKHGCPCVMRGLDGLEGLLLSCFCRAVYLLGMVAVVLPSSTHGKSGTYPRRSSGRTTCCPQKPVTTDRQKQSYALYMLIAYA